MTVARPASAPTWATDANFTNGGTGIAGTPTKVAPSSGVQNEGNVPGTPLPAQRLNWFQNLVGQWTAFLGETGVARTKVISANEFILGQDPSTAVNRWVIEGSGAFGNAPRARPVVDHAFASILLNLPLGAVISKIEIIVSADSSRATSTDQWQVRAFSRLWTWGVTPTATLTELGTGPYGDGTGTGLRVITISGLSTTVVADTDYPVWVQAPNSHGASDHLLACRVTYTAPRVAD